MAGRRRCGGRCSSPAAPPASVLENEDLLEDILLRLPPQPSSLARAASVCKIWRRVVSSPGFLRRCRARQLKPPLLGLFMGHSGRPIFRSVMDTPDAISKRRFRLWSNAGDTWALFGVRHGRVLVFNYTRHEFIVWDPATGDRRCVAMPQRLRDEKMFVCNGAVMCAAGDHSSPFQLVMIGVCRDEKRAVASVYSSGTGEWGDFSSVAIREYNRSSPSILIGDSLYWLLHDSEARILKFDLRRRSLSVIQFPPDMMDHPSLHNCQIISAEDGGIGLAVMAKLTLDMWDRKVSIDGVDTWVLRKTVKLKKITGLSRGKRGHMIIHGYDEDGNVIFLRTDIGCFMVQLESMQFKNIGKRGFSTARAYHPYRSFYSCKGFTLDYRMVWSDCITVFEEQKLDLQDVLNSADCRISLKTETLKLNETTRYMCLTCHFISADWKVQKRIIKFFVVEKPHGCVKIFNVVLKCIQEWNIEEKIFAITLGNAAANDIMVDMLKHNLLQKELLPVEGKLFYNPCAAHIINLIVNDCLKLVDPVVFSKIREAIEYAPTQTFKETIAEDDPACWDTAYWLLNMAVDFRGIFDSALKDANCALSFEEWEQAGVVCRLLEACYEATRAISRSCCTSNLYFHAIWKVKLALDREASNVKNTVQNMVKEMKKTFDKYWVDSYVSLSIPVVLDPRFKYRFVEFRFTQSFGADADKCLKGVRGILQGMFDEYSSQSNDCNVDPAQHGCNREMLTMSTELDRYLNESPIQQSKERRCGLEMVMMAMADKDAFADWYKHLRNNIQVSTESDIYFNESPIQQPADFDILKWWMVYSPVYPTLARIARDVLAMPLSTVASKSAFSTKERTISDHHSNFTAETTEALICLHDWFRASDSFPMMRSVTNFSDRDPSLDPAQVGATCTGLPDEFSIDALYFD